MRLPCILCGYGLIMYLERGSPNIIVQTHGIPKHVHSLQAMFSVL
jgi:hypothetical protein